MKILIEFPFVLPSMANTRLHWSKRAGVVQQQREIMHLEWIRVRRPKVTLPCTIHLARRAPRSLDSDNLQSSFKAIRDQIAAEIGFDDRDARATWVYSQEKSKEASVSVGVEWGK